MTAEAREGGRVGWRRTAVALLASVVALASVHLGTAHDPVALTDTLRALEVPWHATGFLSVRPVARRFPIASVDAGTIVVMSEGLVDELLLTGWISVTGAGCERRDEAALEIWPSGIAFCDRRVVFGPPRR